MFDQERTPDARRGQRRSLAAGAECVMLNKGPFILEAVRTLDDRVRTNKEYQRSFER